MGLNVGGYADRPDWPKLGPSLLIAACMIVAIRTAKWPAITIEHGSERDLEREIEFSARMAAQMMSHLLKHHAVIFPQCKEPWYQPDGEDQPK